MKRKFELINKTSEEIFNINLQLQQYIYDNNYSLSENIQALTQFLKVRLAVNIISPELTFDEDDSPLDKIEPWKLQALFQSLEHTNLIEDIYISYIFTYPDIETFIALSNMIKNTSSLESISIHCDPMLPPECATIFADALRINKSVKYLSFTGDLSAESIIKLLESLKVNTIIEKVQLDKVLSNNSTVASFAEMIKCNETLIEFESEIVDCHHMLDLQPLINALEYNNNLTKLFLESDIENDEGYGDFEKDFTKLVLSGKNKTLTSDPLPATPYKMSCRLEENKNFIKTLAEDLYAFDVTSCPLAQHIKILIGFENIGKNLLKSKLKLQGYKYTKGLDGDTEKNYDLIKEHEAIEKIKSIENFCNDNYFYYKGITKNICEAGLPQKLWSKIASYCKLENPTSQIQLVKLDVELVGIENSNSDEGL